jgi:hypothetical protein
MSFDFPTTEALADFESKCGIHTDHVVELQLLAAALHGATRTYKEHYITDEEMMGIKSEFNKRWNLMEVQVKDNELKRDAVKLFLSSGWQALTRKQQLRVYRIKCYWVRHRARILADDKFLPYWRHIVELVDAKLVDVPKGH